MTPKRPSGRGPHRLGGPDTSHRGCVLTRLSVLHGVRNGKPRLILPGLFGAVYIGAGEYRCRTERRCPAPIGPSNTAWVVLGIRSHEIGRAQATNIPIRPPPPGGPVTHYYDCCMPAEVLSSVLRDCCPFLRSDRSHRPTSPSTHRCPWVSSRRPTKYGYREVGKTTLPGSKKIIEVFNGPARCLHICVVPGSSLAL